MKHFGDKYQLCKVKDVDENLQKIKDLLQRGCDRSFGELTPEIVIDWFRKGDVKFWINKNVDCLLVTEIEYNQGGRVDLNVILWCGHVIDDWDTTWECLKEIACIENCFGISMRGRRGFMQRFKKYGVKEKYVIMQIDL